MPPHLLAGEVILQYSLLDSIGLDLYSSRAPIPLLVGNFAEALAVMDGIESRAPLNMCVLNHKLNLLRRHGDDLTELYRKYIANKKLSVDCSVLLTCKFARYLHKVGSNYYHAASTITSNSSVFTRLKLEPLGGESGSVRWSILPKDVIVYSDGQVSQNRKVIRAMQI